MFADVTSANVVGYQNREIEPGMWPLVCNTFKAIGKDKADMTLGDFKVAGAWSFWGGDNVMLLNPDGSVKQLDDQENPGDTIDAAYTYATVDGEGAPVDGWYQFTKALNEFNFNYPGDDESIEYGDGFVALVGNPDTQLAFFGEVPAGPQNLACEEGTWQLLGNALPVACTIDDITPNEMWSFWGGDNIMILNSDGSVKQLDDLENPGDTIDAAYTYATVDGEGAPENGWYQFTKALNEFNFNYRSEEEFAAGDAFVVLTSTPGTEIQLKQAIAK